MPLPTKRLMPKSKPFNQSETLVEGESASPPDGTLKQHEPVHPLTVPPLEEDPELGLEKTLAENDLAMEVEQPTERIESFDPQTPPEIKVTTASVFQLSPADRARRICDAVRTKNSLRNFILTMVSMGLPRWFTMPAERRANIEQRFIQLWENESFVANLVKIYTSSSYPLSDGRLYRAINNTIGLIAVATDVSG